MTNPFRAHTRFIQAQEAAREGGSATAVAGYDLMLMQLGEHRRRLKGIQSNERKAELKREFLPLYAAWIAGLLEADVARQDDVAMYILIWRIDAGDYAGALDIARHALRHGWVMPSQRFSRTTATVVAEEFADAAMRAFAVKETFNAALLTQALEIVDPFDMPDQSRARIYKSLGYALRDNDQAVAALNHLKRALQLDGGCGVKTDIKQLEARLRKATTG
ncbi:phage terminase small subunit [Cedecea lapagei]|uniref:phage terminase small subunit n=1 Tax=Cedecea lapagei TaxID=158823 RepID=UPI001BCA694F|nr:phage terminase small subunit [Cedecea lapagei]